MTLHSDIDLKRLLGLNDSVNKLCEKSLYDVFNELKENPNDRFVIVTEDKLTKLFSLVRKDAYQDASNPAFYMC